MNDFRVEYEGIRFVLPASVGVSEEKNFKVITNLKYLSDVDIKCKMKDWGKNDSFATVPPRNYEIVQEGNGFRIVVQNAEGRPYRDLDNVTFYIGKNSYANGLQKIGYNHLSPPVWSNFHN